MLEHGLIGLTLRPLAAAIGTSDRMLIYHFGSRDALIAEVVAHIGDVGTSALASTPAAPSVRSAVNRLWLAFQRPPLQQCQDVYIQAAATGLIGVEPHLSVARASNARWTAEIAAYLIRSGAPARRAERIATLVDSALYGFHLDLTTDRPEELSRAVNDLARAAQAIADR